MMAIVLQNAILADIDPIRVEHGGLRIDGGLIVERGKSVSHGLGDEVIDCGGCVVLPGLVNGHTHLYSALATGMPAPPKSPENFHEILQYVWWRLDRALDAESIEMSAKIGALDALKCGTTTLIDHHASPSCIADSLDLIEQGIDAVGLRGVLCYETTDRNGIAGREAGLDENRRYLEKFQRQHSQHFAAMVGAHASFTLEDETLDALADIAATYDTGVHIHVAEDPHDEDTCQADQQMFLIDRLSNHKLLHRDAIFAHGTHLDPEAIGRVSDVGLTLAHNPRSNMNNGVGYTPVGMYRCPVMLGTDGHFSDMFAEAKYAWFKACDERAGVTPQYIIAMLANAARRASAVLDVTLGKLEPEAAADIVITDYHPSTPLTSENLPGHFLYGMTANQVAGVIVNGEWKLRERTVLTIDEWQTRTDAAQLTQALWRRMGEIPI